MKRKFFTLFTLFVLGLAVSSTVFMQTAEAMPRVGSGGHGDKGSK